MTKLLTEQELRERISSTIRWHSSEMITLGKQRKINSTENHNKQVLCSEEMALQELMPLIQSQKQAHADMVIGEDVQQDRDPDEGYCIKCDFESTDGSGDCRCVYDNRLRAEQRERNTL